MLPKWLPLVALCIPLATSLLVGLVKHRIIQYRRFFATLVGFFLISIGIGLGHGLQYLIGIAIGPANNFEQSLSSLDFLYGYYEEADFGTLLYYLLYLGSPASSLVLSIVCSPLPRKRRFFLASLVFAISQSVMDIYGAPIFEFEPLAFSVFLNLIGSLPVGALAIICYEYLSNSTSTSQIVARWAPAIGDLILYSLAGFFGFCVFLLRFPTGIRVDLTSPDQVFITRNSILGGPSSVPHHGLIFSSDIVGFNASGGSSFSIGGVSPNNDAEPARTFHHGFTDSTLQVGDKKAIVLESATSVAGRFTPTAENFYAAWSKTDPFVGNIFFHGRHSIAFSRAPDDRRKWSVEAISSTGYGLHISLKSKGYFAFYTKPYAEIFAPGDQRRFLMQSWWRFGGEKPSLEILEVDGNRNRETHSLHAESTFLVSSEYEALTNIRDIGWLFFDAKNAEIGDFLISGSTIESLHSEGGTGQLRIGFGDPIPLSKGDALRVEASRSGFSLRRGETGDEKSFSLVGDAIRVSVNGERYENTIWSRFSDGVRTVLLVAMGALLTSVLPRLATGLASQFRQFPDLIQKFWMWLAENPTA